MWFLKRCGGRAETSCGIRHFRDFFVFAAAFSSPPSIPSFIGMQLLVPRPPRRNSPRGVPRPGIRRRVFLRRFVAAGGLEEREVEGFWCLVPKLLSSMR